MIEFKYDTQLLIEGQDLSEESIKNHINYNFEGDCLLVVGDSDLIKLHFHTNKPWEIIEYCSSLGEIFDIVIEDMSRQEKGLRG